MNKADVVKTIQIIFSEHNDYWQNKSSEMKKYRDVYQTQFWRTLDYDASMIRVETPDGYSYIESYIASLFTRAPAVVVGKDIAATVNDGVQGNPDAAQSVINRWLFNKREQIENASRLALIYDYAALKLIPQNSEQMLDKAEAVAVPPWEVIVDRDAGAPQQQRFIGHTYFMTLTDAKARFGAKKFTAIPKLDYFDKYGPSNAMPRYDGQARQSIDDLPDSYLYIQVVELYDLLQDEVYFWTPQYANGAELLDRAQIPLRTSDERPLPPLSLLYYSRVPDSPMEGISAMGRVYDQLYEKNILRTYWANSVRRDSRQYIYKEGTMDEEALAKVTAGVDGAMIAVDNDTLDGVIREVPITPISTNFDRYSAYLEQDLTKGSVIQSFAGEPTKASATEITAIASYAASEMGKLARERDSMIENISLIYLRYVYLMAEEGQRAIVDANGKAVVVTPEDLNAQFKIVALDQGSQPLADALKKQNLVALLPTLQSLGVPGDILLEEVVRAYELPRTFLDKAREAMQMAQGAPQGDNVRAPTSAAASRLEAGPTEQINSASQIANRITRGGPQQ
jgi:hypothetical protein